MSTKIVYQTAPDGRYVGPTEADESPLEPGVWLIPAGAVETPPPEAPEGHFARWSGKVWEVVPVPAPPEPEESKQPPAKRAPPAVTRRQLRLWLVRHGIPLSAVEAAIDELPEPQRTEARIEWEDASIYEQSHPLLTALAGKVLNLSGDELEQTLTKAFSEAATY
jgi:hypothetical protein